MEQHQEDDVARGLRAGDADAWQALYDAYAVAVWRYAARLMGPDASDVADVVQETFLAAARCAQKYDRSRGSLRNWLTGIARNHAAIYLRKQHRRTEVLEEMPRKGAATTSVARWLSGTETLPADAATATELAGAVRSTLAGLSAEYGLLLTAKYCDGDSVEEIASKQQCTSTAIRSRLARAREAFRRAFRAAYP